MNILVLSSVKTFSIKILLLEVTFYKVVLLGVITFGILQEGRQFSVEDNKNNMKMNGLNNAGYESDYTNKYPSGDFIKSSRL